jgi:hypothetical protein
MNIRIWKTWVIAAMLLTSATFIAGASREKAISISCYRARASLASAADLAGGWSTTYGGPGDDWANSIIQTSDGGYALVGVTSPIDQSYYDSLLVRTDSAGNMQWNKTYGGTGDNELYSIVQTSDGGYALAGTTDSFGAGNLDFWLVKTDSVGNVQWNWTYGGAGIDVANSIVQTSDGGYALAGFTDSYGAGSYDFWLVKVDSAGVMQWNATYGEGPRGYGGSGVQKAYSIIQTNDGGYALTGYFNYPVRIPNRVFWLVKTDLSGREQWNQTYVYLQNNLDIAYSVVQASDGGYALAGCPENPYDGTALLVKTDSNGNMTWSQTIAPGGICYSCANARSLIQTSEGGYALAGYLWQAASGPSDGAGLIKTDSMGNIQWYRVYDGSGSVSVASSIIMTGDGGYALGGYTDAFDTRGNIDFWFIKTDANGELHDVAVVNATSEKTIVGEGFSDNIIVTVANEGTYNETFNVAAFANGTIIVGPQSVTLSGGGSTNVSFTWTTPNPGKGNYMISAYAVPVLGETDTSDNNFTGGWVVVAMIGDLTGPIPGVPDGKVDIIDIATVAKAFGSVPGTFNWNANCDVNNDGRTDIIDIALVAKHFGEVSP